MGNKSTGTVIRRLLMMISPVFPTMLFSMLMGIIGNVFSITVMVGSALLFAKLLGMDTGISVTALVAAILVAALLRGIMRYLEQYSGHDAAFRLLALIRDKAYEALRRLAPAKLSDKSAGDIISTVMGDVEYIEVFFAHTIAPVVIGIIVSLGVLIFIGSYWAGFALILLAFQLLVGLVIPLYASKAGREDGRNYRKESANMGTFLLDSLHGMKELLLMNLGEQRLEEMKHRGMKLNREHGKLKRHEGRVTAMADLCVMLAITVILVISAIRCISGMMEPAEVLIVTVAASSSFGPLIALSSLSNSLLQTFAAAERLFALMDEKPPVEEIILDNTTPKVKEGSVEYCNICFQYPKREQVVVEKLDFKLDKGSLTALIGESGCGKSTLLHLLLRFWDVDSGSICVDENDIRKYELSKLRQGITLVSQQTWLFNESIEENIRLGKPEADTEEIITAAKRASIHEFIMSLPEGYGTRVGELGSRLSSGEQQRIGLARAFLRETPLVLLDEPTSSLDSLNEKAVLKTIRDEMKGKTVLLVSHRPSTIAVSDKVYRMREGYIEQVLEKTELS